MNLNGTNYYYVLDLQGNVVALEDTHGTIVVTYQYDSWGNIINTTDTSGVNLAQINPFRYRSYYYDSETNLYYLNSRYYNPTIGRFISADSQLNSGVLGNNMYIYCNNNPVMYVDPDGNSFQSWLKDRWDVLKSWWNEVPQDPFTIPSSSDVMTTVAGLLLGTSMDSTSSLLKSNYYKIGIYKRNFLGIGRSLIKSAKALNISSYILGYGLDALDIGNTWFNQKSTNTNGQRVEKTVIQVTGMVMDIGIDIEGVSTIVAGITAAPETGMVSVLTLVPLGVTEIYSGNQLVSEGQNYLYKQLNIE